MKPSLLSATTIEQKSFAIIDSFFPEPRPFAGRLWQIARRCIHTVGDPSIVSALRFSEQALESGLAALRRGCTVYTDTKMAQVAISGQRMKQLGCKVISVLELPGVAEKARAQNVTRSRMGIFEIAKLMADQIIVIGNAPTALYALLELLAYGEPAPALIVGMPVGFVNAKETKDALQETPYAHFTLLGWRGGSAIAACCINAMAEMVLADC